MLTLTYKHLEIIISGESPDIPRYQAQSTDRLPGAEEEYYLDDDGCRPSSRHRITLRSDGDVVKSRVLLANGGASGVHTHSAFIRGDKCFIAIGPFVCALELPTLQLLWHSRADSATCFGVHDAPAYASIISHGELEIARLTYSGQKIWSSSGADIFTEEFKLHEHHAEVVDFSGIRYRFELKTGQIQIITVADQTDGESV